MSDFRDYENAVADIFSFLTEGAATVQRNVHLTGRRTGRARQVDVLVRGRVFGLDDATLAIDCKRWTKKVSVTDVERFIGTLDDLGADLGLLVTTTDYSAAARDRARQERGIRTEVVTLQEVERWHPRGTVHSSYRVAIDAEEAATNALRRAGFRVRRDAGLATGEGEVVLEAFRHYGGGGTAEEQRSLMETAGRALERDGISAQHAASGVAVGGGTPAHRWLDVVHFEGVHLDLKILADTEDEVDRQLHQIAGMFESPRAVLDVERPADWPVEGLFGLPGAPPRVTTAS